MKLSHFEYTILDNDTTSCLILSSLLLGKVFTLKFLCQSRLYYVYATMFLLHETHRIRLWTLSNNSHTCLACGGNYKRHQMYMRSTTLKSVWNLLDAVLLSLRYGITECPVLRSQKSPFQLLSLEIKFI